MPDGQLDLEDFLRGLTDPFQGTTYVPSLDRDRLGEQLCRVIDAMSDGSWKTLREIASITDDPEASISARLRDVRKIWGTEAMECRRRVSAGMKRGLFEYRIQLTEN